MYNFAKKSGKGGSPSTPHPPTPYSSDAYAYYSHLVINTSVWKFNAEKEGSPFIPCNEIYIAYACTTYS